MRGTHIPILFCLLLFASLCWADTNTTDPQNTTEPTNTTQPTNTTEPTNSTNPTNTTEPTNPTNSTDPTNSTQPVSKSDPNSIIPKLICQPDIANSFTAVRKGLIFIGRGSGTLLAPDRTPAESIRSFDC